jgi:tetratricopeptide (TPR) repeat protein
MTTLKTSRIFSLTACAFMLFCAATVRAQNYAAGSSQYYKDAQAWWNQGRSLEQRNNLRGAFEAYSNALSNANGAVTDASNNRSPAYVETCLRAFVEFDIARMFYALEGTATQVSDYLGYAERDLTYTLTSPVYKYNALLGSQSQPWTLYNALGYIYFMKGDVSKARNAFQQALQLNSNFKPAADALFMLENFVQGGQRSTTPNGVAVTAFTKDDLKRFVKGVRPYVDLILTAMFKKYGLWAMVGINLVDFLAAQNGM